jgi:hypothetical protein
LGRNKTTKKTLGGGWNHPRRWGEIHRRPRWPQQMEQCALNKGKTYLFLYAGPNGVRLTAAKQRGHRLVCSSSPPQCNFVLVPDDECAPTAGSIFSLNLIKQMHSWPLLIGSDAAKPQSLFVQWPAHFASFRAAQTRTSSGVRRPLC